MSESPKVPSRDEIAVVEPVNGPVFAPHESPAGGWGALDPTAKASREQSSALKGSWALLFMNQKDGFDCPGCAWPDPQQHSINQLAERSDYLLKEQGWLTEPMRYDPAIDHYVPVSWEAAFALISRELGALSDPNEAEFYISGRTSSETAFLYQLFVRRFGMNNFPDCSPLAYHDPARKTPAAKSIPVVVKLQPPRETPRNAPLSLGRAPGISARTIRVLAVVMVFVTGTSAAAARDPTQVRVPANLETPQAVQAGAHQFRETCVRCHGAPGIAPSISGLSPAPPKLLAAHRRNEPADIFGKVENGIAGTAMPAFRGSLSDESIWNIAAFLHHSRGITVDAFAALTTAKSTANRQ
jgi:mono/diheme cytochrome c family protein